MSVIVYSTPTCTWCHKAKDYLRDHQIEFKEVNVAEDYTAAMEMVQKSGQRGVPVLDINGTIIVGFNQPAIDRTLGLNK